MNKIIFRFHLEMSRGVLGFLAKTEMKADTKLTFVMCRQMFDRKSVVAIFCVVRRHGRPVEKIRNFEIFFFNKNTNIMLPRPRLDFCGGGYPWKFVISSSFLAGRLGRFGPQLKI